MIKILFWCGLPFTIFGLLLVLDVLFESYVRPYLRSRSEMNYIYDRLNKLERKNK